VTTIGYHCILELNGCPAELLDDRDFVLEAVREAAIAADLTLLGEVSHGFTPQGVTALALLSESHISVHTWPELGYAAADVFTCGEHANPREACEHLARRFQASEQEVRVIPRGVPAPRSAARQGIDGHRAGHAPSGPSGAVTRTDAESAEARSCPVRG
jgi:S-adenosylmethionine decarboxylase